MRMCLGPFQPGRLPSRLIFLPLVVAKEADTLATPTNVPYCPQAV